MTNTPTMLTYIEGTPEQIACNVERSKQLTKELVDLYVEKNYENIWIIACGSSSNGSNCAKPFMMKYLNCDVKIVPPNTFIYGEDKMKETDLAFVISQSGCSTNSIEALDKLKAMGCLAVGLTGNVNSDFKDHADVVIDYGVGIETVGYVTKGVTTLAQFLMLFALEAALTKGILPLNTYQEIIDEMKEVPARHKKVQEETWDFYQKNHKEMTSMTVANCCGFAQGYGVATEGALKIGETIQIPSFAYEAEEWIHGPNLQLTPNYTIFLIDDLMAGSSDRLMQIYQASRSVTDRTYAITNSPVVDDDHAIRLPFDIKEPLLLPLYALPFFQIIAHQVTTELHKWEKHPLFEANFKKYADSKTESIKKIMPDL
ncbi:MAG: SIS domain-containing protein [Erysipelotrichaceae bacterium]|nr:SIS domain-containing protein [Erysipelotrichaceae bacterium]